MIKSYGTIVWMKTLILLLFFFTFSVSAFEIQNGIYKIVDGDEELCEEGRVVFKQGDLKIGTRLTLLQIDKKSYTYDSDDKSCSYKIKNIPQKNGLHQEILQKCKNGIFKRDIFLTYLAPKLSYTIISEDMKTKKINCSLEFFK